MKAGFLSLARELSSNCVSFTVPDPWWAHQRRPREVSCFGGRPGLHVHTKLLEDWATWVPEHFPAFKIQLWSKGTSWWQKGRYWGGLLCHLWTKNRSLWRLMDWAYLQVEHARVVVNHHSSLVCFLILSGTNSAGWPPPLQLLCYVSFTEFFVSQQFQKRHCPSNSDNTHACLPPTSIYLSPFLLLLVVSTFSLHSDF